MTPLPGTDPSPGHRMVARSTLQIQAQSSKSTSSMMSLIIFLVWITVVIYLIFLSHRLVTAQERMAETLDQIARKLESNGKP